MAVSLGAVAAARRKAGTWISDNARMPNRSGKPASAVLASQALV